MSAQRRPAVRQVEADVCVVSFRLGGRKVGLCQHSVKNVAIARGSEVNDYTNASLIARDFTTSPQGSKAMSLADSTFPKKEVSANCTESGVAVPAWYALLPQALRHHQLEMRLRLATS